MTVQLLSPLRSPRRETIVDLGVRFLGDCQPPRRLSMREWAEQRVIIPTGQRKNRPFRVATNPWTGLWLDLLDSGRYPINVLTGPTQSGKTVCGFTIPTLYKVDAVRQEVILGIPEGDMVDDKFSRDLWPILDASEQLACLRPVSGAGSRGGKVADSVLLRNGVPIKIITRGGKDTGKAGYTTPNVVMTEAAGWSHASERSQEAAPFWQVYGRLLGFKRHQRRMTVEGTVTVPDELPWSLKGEDADGILSTDSQIVKYCPHCGHWVRPERDHLRGWQEAANIVEAAERAFWACPACGHAISDEDRRAMNAGGVLLHRGQTIDEHGEKHGDDPPTDTLFFRYGAFDNQLLDAADIAPDEWRAAQLPDGTEEREDSEKRLCQQVFCVPFQSRLAEAEPLKAERLRRRQDKRLERGVLPVDTVKVTVGADCGKTTSWWLLLAGRADGTVHVPAYGAFDVCMYDQYSDEQVSEIESRLREALDELIDNTLEGGFLEAAQAGLEAARRLPDSIWIDRGYLKNAVCDVVRRRGTLRDCRYRAAKGYGLTSRSRKPYRHPPKRTPNRIRMGDHWYADVDLADRIVKYNFDADWWKLKIHEWLRTKKGRKGSLTFYREDHPQEHARLRHHLCAEQFGRKWVPGKGWIDGWQKHGANHLLDCAAMAAAALDSVGYNVTQIIAAAAHADDDAADRHASDDAGRSPPDATPPTAHADAAGSDNIYARLLGHGA